MGADAHGHAMSEGAAIVSDIVGWGYFVAWSVSFYPQVWTNWRRKSVVGLSFDFEAYNLIGFACYAAFNCAFFWSKTVQREYQEDHGGHKNLVEINDVVFSLHAIVLTVITVVQIFIYDRGDQVLSLTAKILSSVMLALSVEFAVACALGFSDWLDVLYFLSYVKLFVTSKAFVCLVVWCCVHADAPATSGEVRAAGVPELQEKVDCGMEHLERVVGLHGRDAVADTALL
jgi:cystinosin